MKTSSMMMALDEKIELALKRAPERAQKAAGPIGGLPLQAAAAKNWSWHAAGAAWRCTFAHEEGAG